MSDRAAIGSEGLHPAVRVQAIFRVASDEQAQAVAAKMVDRAHEIANLPECECDVDVSIERLGAGAIGSAEPDVPAEPTALFEPSGPVEPGAAPEPQPARPARL